MEKYGFNDLLSVMDKLLGENGCPWDRAQTHQSIKTELIEECYEVIDAIQECNIAGICEELGDLLLHVVFHSKIAEKNGEFTIDDVTYGITEKLIRRHSHVFGEKRAENADESIDNWDKEKQKEKGYSTVEEQFARIPKAYPALLRAEKTVSVAKKAGVKLDMRALDKNKGQDISEEYIGAELFRIAALAHEHGINAEIALCNHINLFIEDACEYKR